MPAPYRDPDSTLRDNRTAVAAQGRTPTGAETQARRRSGGPGQPGVTHPVWEEVRNGMPATVPYAWNGDRDDRAAWRRVAEVQARLRGQPAPALTGEPWNLPPCDGCGYRMRCSCKTAMELEDQAQGTQRDLAERGTK